MNKIAITILLGCALLGAGCSDSTAPTTSPANLTPMEDFPIAPAAAGTPTPIP
jgi:hypothetical protein